MNHEAYKRKLWAAHAAALEAKEPRPTPDAGPEPARACKPTPETPRAETPQSRWKRKNRERVREYQKEYYRRWRKNRVATEDELAAKREYDRRRYHSDPEFRERKKAATRARYEKMKSDPEAYAAHLEAERERMRKRREKAREERTAACRG